MPWLSLGATTRPAASAITNLLSRRVVIDIDSAERAQKLLNLQPRMGPFVKESWRTGHKSLGLAPFLVVKLGV
ncbi:hypothetical protein PCANC_10204 [Puccinia coronata f. sp. avenae]|uniref:Uncharacterized protein n=1 Tax=Puccinia coronata f. sp. avenae TaxID=200324 RepID=A0A2N5T3C8_9BASI|nr:hypothetical protein PCANC_10204 [Puccinia coronata f. sp. avenae]